MLRFLYITTHRVTQDGWTAMHLVSRKLNDARASVRSSRVGRSSSAQSHNAQQLASDGKGEIISSIMITILGFYRNTTWLLKTFGG